MTDRWIVDMMANGQSQLAQQALGQQAQQGIGQSALNPYQGQLGQALGQRDQWYPITPPTPQALRDRAATMGFEPVSFFQVNLHGIEAFEDLIRWLVTDADYQTAHLSQHEHTIAHAPTRYRVTIAFQSDIDAVKLRLAGYDMTELDD
jgi:hypothetical protein